MADDGVFRTWRVLLQGGRVDKVSAPLCLIGPGGALVFRHSKPDAKGDTGQLIASYSLGEWRRCQMVNEPYGNPDIISEAA